MSNNSNLSDKELDIYIEKVEKLSESLTNGDVDKFLEEKGKKALNEIMEEQDINSYQRSEDYKSGNQTEITKNYIKFYNDSVIDIDGADTWLNDYGKRYYDSTLSLAELVPFIKYLLI